MTDRTFDSPDTSRARAIAALAGCALLWSTSGLFIKFVTWNPIAIAGIRSLIGGILILAYLRRPRFTWSRTQIGAGLLYAGTMITFVAANKLTTAANAIFLQYAAPAYAAVLGSLFLGEKTSWLDWAAMGIVLGGMVLFFFDNLSLDGMAGNIIAVVSGFLFAGAIVLLRKQKDGSPLESILIGHFITFAVSIPFLWKDPPGLVGWGGLAFLGVFQMGFSSILLSYGVRHVTAFQSLLTSIIEPIFNPVWVFVLLGEMPGPRAIAGGAIILAAVTGRSVLSIVRSNSRAALPR